MKKVYLHKTTQDGLTFYIGSADPRDLIRLVVNIEIGATQDAQRPISEVKVKEIAKYVSDDNPYSILPTSITLGTRDRNKLDVVSEIATDERGELIELLYIFMPETQTEFLEYQNTIDVMDGQHRLFAFKDEYRLIDDTEKYEVLFSLFLTPSLELRRRIFMTTNEKQDKVSSNLLMWFRDKLNILRGPEKEYMNIITKLNAEALSPLTNRIVLGAEKISRGYKAQQLIKIFNKAGLKSLSADGRMLTDEELVSLISIYLIGWEKHHNVEYQHPKPEDNAITKISGIRYAILLLPKFWEHSVRVKKKFTKEFVIETLNHLTEAIEIDYEETIFTDETLSLAFRSEGATIKLAEDHGKKLDLFLQNLNNQGGFNPLAGL